MATRVAMHLGMMRRVGLDQLSVLRTAIDVVRRGGTVSIAGVYGGMVDPLPLLTMFDKQLTLRMGQLNARRWLDDLMPLVIDDADPLGTEQFATHRLPLAEAPTAYRHFAKKSDGTTKVLFTP